MCYCERKVSFASLHEFASLQFRLILSQSNSSEEPSSSGIGDQQEMKLSRITQSSRRIDVTPL